MSASSPYILAGSIQAAHRWARENGLTRGHYRLVTGPDSIKSVRGGRVIVLPGWKRRPDRFSIGGALRYTRMTVEYLEDEPVEVEDVEPAEPVDDEPAPAPEVKRRARRCKDCNILVPPDEVEDHAAIHERGE